LPIQVLVLGALKVCLADETLLMHPLVHKVMLARMRPDVPRLHLA